MAARVLIAIGLALALGAISAFQAMISAMNPEDRYTLGHALIMYTPFWVFWAVLFPLVVLIARALPVERYPLYVGIPAHLLIGFGVALLHFTVWLFFMGVIGHANW